MDFAVRTVLWFTTYVQPLIFAARVSRESHARREDVVNATLALVFIWLMEFLDIVLLGRLMAATTLYMILRVGVSWYWMHPRLRGALVMYTKYLKPLLEAHGDKLDAYVEYGMKEVRRVIGARWSSAFNHSSGQPERVVECDVTDDSKPKSL